MRTFRALWCRSVAFCRSRIEVLIHRLTLDFAAAACTAAIVPKTTRVTISTTRPFPRRFSTVA